MRVPVSGTSFPRRTFLFSGFRSFDDFTRKIDHYDNHHNLDNRDDLSFLVVR